MRQLYLCPDGTYVRSKKKQLAAWKKPADLVCEELDLRLIGFNPAYLFADKTSGLTIRLPAWLVIRLSKYCEMSIRNCDGG